MPKVEMSDVYLEVSGSKRMPQKISENTISSSIYKCIAYTGEGEGEGERKVMSGALIEQ